MPGRLHSTSTGQPMRPKWAVRRLASPASGKPNSSSPAKDAPPAAARLAARPPNEWPPATTSGPARAANVGAARSALPRGRATASAARPRARRPST